MDNTHDKILQAVDTYLEENQKFEEKNVKVAATRARKALMDLKNLAHTRRKEIQDQKNGNTEG